MAAGYCLAWLEVYAPGPGVASKGGITHLGDRLTKVIILLSNNANAKIILLYAHFTAPQTQPQNNKNRRRNLHAGDANRKIEIATPAAKIFGREEEE